MDDSVVAGIAVAVCSGWLSLRFLRRMNARLSEMALGYCQLVAVIVAILSGLVVGFGITYWGSTVPGALFEREEYEALFYVYLFPGEQTTRSYRVPGLVSKSVNEYRIRYAVMPDGRIIAFSDASIGLEDIQHGWITRHLEENSNRFWGVVVTTRSANK